MIDTDFDCLSGCIRLNDNGGPAAVLLPQMHHAIGRLSAFTAVSHEPTAGVADTGQAAPMADLVAKLKQHRQANPTPLNHMILSMTCNNCTSRPLARPSLAALMTNSRH